MTPHLRRIHRISWYTLAVLLPLAWLAAVSVIPGEVWQQPVRAEQADPLPVLLESRQSGDFVINLRSDAQGTRRQIEIFIKKPLENPGTALLAGDSNPQLLGLLGTRGIRRFGLDSLGAHAQPPLVLHFEDRIHGRLLRTVRFTK